MAIRVGTRVGSRSWASTDVGPGSLALLAIGAVLVGAAVLLWWTFVGLVILARVALLPCLRRLWRWATSHRQG